MIAIDILFTYIYVKIIIGIELFLSYIHTDISLYLTYVYIYTQAKCGNVCHFSMETTRGYVQRKKQILGDEIAIQSGPRRVP